MFTGMILAGKIGGDMIPERLLEILRCTACVAGNAGAGKDVGVLDAEGDDLLVCRSCGRKYAVRDGIPDMVLDDAGEPER